MPRAEGRRGAGESVAAGVSLPDLLVREGVILRPPRLPFTPGWDLIGMVDRLGAGIREPN